MMKTHIKFRSIATLLVLIFGTISMTSVSQEKGMNHPQNKESHSNKFCESLPDISEDQLAKIKSLRIDHLKKMTPYKNQLQEKKAHHQTLMTAENADMSLIYANIDEITSINNRILKETASHRQSIRKLLTEEQRVIFDQKSHRQNRNSGHEVHGKENSNFGNKSSF